MHIYFSGIGGSGLMSLAQICVDLGFKVSGSDTEDSSNLEILRARGINIKVGQTAFGLTESNLEKPIDWYIHSPAVKQGNLEFDQAQRLGLKMTKQNALINYILELKNLKLIAVAGTHGKTTTTSMIVWLFKKLNIPVSWFIGTTPGFGPGGCYQAGSEYLVMEADEYDKKFLDLSPEISVINSLDFDHPDTYPTQEDYNQSFVKFITQTKSLVCLWEDSYLKLDLAKVSIKSKIYHPDWLAEPTKTYLNLIELNGDKNRQNAFMAISVVNYITNKANTELNDLLKSFVGTQRRYEIIKTNLYSDYAHHPSEIKAIINLALEDISKNSTAQNLIILYQPHQNARQYSIYQDYKDCFQGAKKIYWLPTYLSRENPNQPVLTPEELTQDIKNQDFEIVDFTPELKFILEKHLADRELVLCLGAGSIDAWVRQNLA